MKLHTAHYHGHRVIVVLRSGERIIDRFVEKRSSFLVLKREGRIPFKCIQSLAPYRAALGDLTEGGQHGKTRNEA